MEDKKVLNNEELEKVNGGFGNTLISGTSIPGIDMDEVPDNTPCAVGSGISGEEILEPVDCSGLIP